MPRSDIEFALVVLIAVLVALIAFGVLPTGH